MYIPAPQTAVLLDNNYLFDIHNGRLNTTKSLKYKLFTVKCCNVLFMLLRHDMKVKGLKIIASLLCLHANNFFSYMGKLNVIKMKC